MRFDAGLEPEERNPLADRGKQEWLCHTASRTGQKWRSPAEGHWAVR